MSALEFRTTEWQLARATAPTAVESGLAVKATTLPAAAFCVEGFRGGRIRFICASTTDNDTATATIYSIDGLRGSQPTQNKGYMVDSLGTVAITFSSNSVMAGIADSSVFPSNYFMADTLGAWSPTTPGSARLVYVGGNIASYTGTSNTNAAELLISDFAGCSHIAVVFTTYGLSVATTPINALIKLDC